MKLKTLITATLISMLCSFSNAESMDDLLARLPGKWVDTVNGAKGLNIKFSDYHPDQPWGLITGEVTGQATDPLKLEFLNNKPAGMNNAVYFLRVTNLKLNTVHTYTMTTESSDKNGNFDFWEYILDSNDSHLTADGIRLAYILNDDLRKNTLLFAWFGGNGYCTSEGKTEQCETGQNLPYWIKKEN